MSKLIIPRAAWRTLAGPTDTCLHPYWFDTIETDDEHWVVALQTQILGPSGPHWTVQATVAETEERATEVKDHLRSCIDPCHADFESTLARPQVAPNSPTDPAYWAMDPAWELFEVPDRAARRLARRATDLMRFSYQGTDEAGSLDEVLAWAAVASITDDYNDLWYEAALPSPVEVRTRFGLTVDLAPAQLVAACWRLEQLLVEGSPINTRPPITDASQTATATRVRALSRWIADGHRLADLNVRMPTRGNGDDADRVYPNDVAWLAYELPAKNIAHWRAVLVDLRRAETIENIADLAPLWLNGISPQTALIWRQALDQRSTETGVWRDIVCPVVEYGIEPADLIAWIDAHPEVDRITDHVETILELVREGWMSPVVRHIPWPVRDEYRTEHRKASVSQPGEGMSPHTAAHVWFPLRQANKHRHDQLLELLRFRAEEQEDGDIADGVA